MGSSSLRRVKKTVRGKNGKTFQRTVMVRATPASSHAAKYGRRGMIAGALMGAIGGATVGGTAGAAGAAVFTRSMINSAIHNQGRANNPLIGLDPGHSARIHAQHKGVYVGNAARGGAAGSVFGAVVGAAVGAAAGRQAGRALGVGVDRVQANGNRVKLPPQRGRAP
jgi:outer membrane lipoprotein SlyB